MRAYPWLLGSTAIFLLSVAGTAVAQSKADML